MLFAEILKKSKLTSLPFTLDSDFAQLGNGSDRKRQAGLAVASTYGITAVQRTRVSKWRLV